MLTITKYLLEWEMEMDININLELTPLKAFVEYSNEWYDDNIIVSIKLLNLNFSAVHVHVYVMFLPFSFFYYSLISKI